MQPMTYERRDERFSLVMNSQEKAALQVLANRERLSAAATLRRLIWQAVDERAVAHAARGAQNAERSTTYPGSTPG